MVDHALMHEKAAQGDEKPRKKLKLQAAPALQRGPPRVVVDHATLEAPETEPDLLDIHQMLQECPFIRRSESGRGPEPLPPAKQPSPTSVAGSQTRDPGGSAEEWQRYWQHVKYIPPGGTLHGSQGLRQDIKPQGATRFQDVDLTEFLKPLLVPLPGAPLPPQETQKEPVSVSSRDYLQHDIEPVLAMSPVLPLSELSVRHVSSSGEGIPARGGTQQQQQFSSNHIPLRMAKGRAQTWTGSAQPGDPSPSLHQIGISSVHTQGPQQASHGGSRAVLQPSDAPPARLPSKKGGSTAGDSRSQSGPAGGGQLHNAHTKAMGGDIRSMFGSRVPVPVQGPLPAAPPARAVQRCPICDFNFPVTATNVEVNQHIDACLEQYDLDDDED